MSPEQFVDILVGDTWYVPRRLNDEDLVTCEIRIVDANVEAKHSGQRCFAFESNNTIELHYGLDEPVTILPRTVFYGYRCDYGMGGAIYELYGEDMMHSPWIHGNNRK